MTWLADEVLPLLLYLCSEQPDIPAHRPPPLQRSKTTGRLIPPDAPQLWDVGVRIGAALRKSRQENRDRDQETASGGTARKRPHMRAAHWHTYWTGPRKNDQQQQPRIRWIPPLGVNLDLGDTVPTVRPVRKSKNPA